MDETCLCHYDPETKQQSMEWRDSGSTRPQKFRVQKSAGKVLALIFLGSKRHPSHWLSSKGRNYQHGVSLISTDAIEGHFEGKTSRVHQGGLVLARVPRLTGHMQPRRNWPTWASNHPPYSPDLSLSDYHLFPGLKKLKGSHFSSDAEVIAAAETWLDWQLSDFFWVACKSKSNRLRSVLSFVGSMLNKSRVCSL